MLWMIVMAVPVVGLVLGSLFQNEKTTPKSPDTMASKPSQPPPKFHILRQEAGLPIPVIVSRDVTEEQLHSLLWFFRQNVRARKFAQLGLKKPTGPANTGFAAGMVEVFRDARYASEAFTRKEGETSHADALYSWGLDRVADHDQAFVKGAGGSVIKVFDYSDNWQLPTEEQRQVDEEKEVAARCTTDDPAAKVAADMALYSWEKGSSSAQYWVGGIERQRLFAVKDYEFQNGYYIPDTKTIDGRKPNSAAFKFRIESSTQGGFPITKDWYIDVTLGAGACGVYKVEEAD